MSRAGPRHPHAPQPLGEQHPGVAGAPAVLLADERVELVRADAGRQHDRQVDHLPAGPAHVQAGVHVLGVGDERRAALRLQRRPPVHRGGAHADGLAEPVPGHLDRPVEDLLDRAGRPLDPGLPRAAAEVLRRLDDGDRRIVHVGERLGQEVAARREVGVQDDDELALGAGRTRSAGCRSSCARRVAAAPSSRTRTRRPAGRPPGRRRRRARRAGPRPRTPAISAATADQVLRSTSSGSPQIGR